MTIKEREDPSVLRYWLKEWGIIIIENGKRDGLVVDERTLHQNIHTWLKVHEASDHERLLALLEYYIEDEEAFRRALLPMEDLDKSIMRDEDYMEGAHGTLGWSMKRLSVHESWMKKLLEMKELQRKLLELLLEKLPEYIVSEGSEMPRLIIQQFRWLGHIVNSKWLTDKILQIVDMTPAFIQKDIITYLPDIIQDSERKEVISYLNQLLINRHDLMAFILDAFASFGFDPKLLEDTLTRVLSLLPSAEMEMIPVMLKFLLQSANGECIPMVFRSLRTKLDIDALSEEQEQFLKGHCKTSKASIEMLVFDTLKSVVQFRKELMEVCLNELSNISETPNSFDFILLLMMRSIPTFTKSVELVMKKLFLTENFSTSFLQTVCRKHHGVLKQREYFMALHETLISFIRSDSTFLQKYASLIFTTSFEYFGQFQQQEMIGSLIMHIGGAAMSETDVCLNILLDLALQHTAMVRPFMLFIKAGLDVMDDLSISQIKILFTIICRLSANNEENLATTEDLHILVRKQLSSESSRQKAIGIVGGLAFLRASNLYQKKNSDLFNTTIKLLDFIHNSCRRNEDCLAFFYTELADAIQANVFDVDIMHHIQENIANLFQDYFLCDLEDFKISSEPDSLDIVPKIWMNLDEQEASIFVKIIEVVSNDFEKNKKLIMLLCPLFRILQLCERHQYEGSLENIDALIGCPIALFSEKDTKDFNALNQNARQKIIRAIFYTINWFREVINSFLDQECPEILDKIKRRLKDVSEMDYLFETFLPLATSFTIDDIVIHDFKSGQVKLFSKPLASSGAKRKSSKDSFPDLESENVSKSKHKTNKKSAKLEDCRSYFVGLSPAAMIYGLSQDFSFDITPEDSASLTTRELKFLLKETLYFVESFIGSYEGKKKPEMLYLRAIPHLAINGFDFFDWFEKCLPYLCHHLEKIMDHVRLSRLENDGICDLETDKNWSQSIEIILNILIRILQCPTLATKDNVARASSILHQIGPKNSKSMTGPLENSAISSFDYLSCFASDLPSLESAVVYHKLIKSVSNFLRDPTMYKSILSSRAASFLKLKPLVAKSKYDKLIAYLLYEFISNCNNDVKVIEELSASILKVYKNGQENEESLDYENHPLLNHTTLSVYYKCTFACLCTTLLNNGDRSEDPKEYEHARIARIRRSVAVLHEFLYISKSTENRQIFSACLKYGRIFVEEFLKHSMPFISMNFRFYREDITSILKNLQQSTRSLQILCSHSKVVKDVGLTANVPALRKTLETLVFKVKAMLNANDCITAFWIGNLKHRTINGDEVSSQIPLSDNDNIDSDVDMVDTIALQLPQSDNDSNNIPHFPHAFDSIDNEDNDVDNLSNINEASTNELDPNYAKKKSMQADDSKPKKRKIMISKAMEMWLDETEINFNESEDDIVKETDEQELDELEKNDEENDNEHDDDDESVQKKIDKLSSSQRNVFSFSDSEEVEADDE